MGASNRFSEAQKTERSPPVEFQISAPKYLPTETGWRHTGKANAVCLRRGSPAVHLPSLCGQTTAIPFFLDSNAAPIGLEATDGEEKKPMPLGLSGNASTFFWASKIPQIWGVPLSHFSKSSKFRSGNHLPAWTPCHPRRRDRRKTSHPDRWQSNAAFIAGRR